MSRTSRIGWLYLALVGAHSRCEEVSMRSFTFVDVFSSSLHVVANERLVKAYLHHSDRGFSPNLTSPHPPRGPHHAGQLQYGCQDG